MRTLTFFPRTADGSSQAFCVADIASAEAEALFVRQMFDIHASATIIEVFEDEVPAGSYIRDTRNGPTAALARAHPYSRGLRDRQPMAARPITRSPSSDCAGS